MADIFIPPAALEAGARAFIGYGVDAAVWDHLGDAYKIQLQKEMSAAFLAMIEAWPGMHIHEWQRPWLGGMSGIDLILPLPQEASDDPQKA